MSFSFSFSLSCSLSSFLLSLSFFSSFSSRLECHSQYHDHGGLHLYASKHLLSSQLQAKSCSVKLPNAKLKLPCVWKIVHWRACAGNGNRIVVSTLWFPLSSKLRCCTDPWYFNKKGAPVQLPERFQTPDLAECQKPRPPVLRQEDCKEKVLTRCRYLLCILSKTVKKGQILADTSERSRKKLHTCLTPRSAFKESAIIQGKKVGHESCRQHQQRKPENTVVSPSRENAERRAVNHELSRTQQLEGDEKKRPVVSLFGIRGLSTNTRDNRSAVKGADRHTR